MDKKWNVIKYKDVDKDIKKLKSAHLLNDYIQILEILKENPFKNVRHFEKLRPHNRELYSMRINIQHRLVYTVDKERHLVKIWSAWSHYAQL